MELQIWFWAVQCFTRIDMQKDERTNGGKDNTRNVRFICRIRWPTMHFYFHKCKYAKRPKKDGFKESDLGISFWCGVGNVLGNPKAQPYLCPGNSQQILKAWHRILLNWIWRLKGVAVLWSYNKYPRTERSKVIVDAWLHPGNIEGVTKWSSSPAEGGQLW